MKIYIARHGETDFNKAKRLMGPRIDTVLNLEGIKQANNLAQNLVGENFDVIFTSPLKRALQTAQIISKKINAPIVEKNEIAERDYEVLSGKTWDEVNAEFGKGEIDFRERDFAQEYDYRPYGGESVEEVKKRFLMFIDELKRNYSGKKILIITPL